MKPIIKIILLATIGLFFLGCQEKVETNVQNLELFFSGKKLTLIEEHFGGLGGVFKKKLEFIQNNDSVKVIFSDVEVTLNSRRNIIISTSDFDEIKKGLKCIATNHIEKENPSPNCIISSPNQYFLRFRNKEMRLFDSKSDCNFDELLFKKLDHPNIMDLIDEFG